jgi:hypothetical protein
LALLLLNDDRLKVSLQRKETLLLPVPGRDFQSGSSQVTGNLLKVLGLIVPDR